MISLRCKNPGYYQFWVLSTVLYSTMCHLSSNVDLLIHVFYYNQLMNVIWLFHGKEITSFLCFINDLVTCSFFFYCMTLISFSKQPPIIASSNNFSSSSKDILIDIFMSGHFYVATYLCHCIFMSRYFYITTYLCHRSFMSPQFYVTTFLWLDILRHDIFMAPNFYVTTFLWLDIFTSRHSISLYICVTTFSDLIYLRHEIFLS